MAKHRKLKSMFLIGVQKCTGKSKNYKNTEFFNRYFMFKL